MGIVVEDDGGVRDAWFHTSSLLSLDFQVKLTCMEFSIICMSFFQRNAMPKYEIKCVVKWTVDYDIEPSAREKIHQKAIDEFSSFFYPPAGMNASYKVTSDLVKDKDDPAMIVLGTFSADEVLSHLLTGKGSKKTYKIGKKEYSVKMNSDRYKVFKKNPSCVCCGLTATKARLEMTRGTPTPHFNLYGVDAEGTLILMTKDHIIPKSKGGKNSMDNYVTMCRTCNTLKANAIITVEQTKELRKIHDASAHLGIKAKGKLMSAERNRLAKEAVIASEPVKVKSAS